MIQALLLLTTLAAAAWALGAARTPQPERVPATLRRLAWLFALEHVLFEAGHLPLPAPLLGGVVQLRGFVAIGMWCQVAWLSAYGQRTKAARVRLVFAAITVMIALARADWGALAVLSLPAVLSFGWRRALGTRQLFATAVTGLALLAFGAFARLRLVPEPVPAGAMLGMWHYAKWANVVTIAYLGFGAMKALDEFVRDPSLGIRTVRRRLALSHILVVTVPVLILGGMWAFTTWLGVNSDRAVVATQAIAEETRDLGRALEQAMRPAGDPRAALAAVGAVRRASWPEVRVWRIEGASLHRVYGDSIEAERRLVGWCAGLDTLRPGGIVQIGDRRYLGAAVRDSARGGCGVALVPVHEALHGAPARVAGARLWMLERVPHPSTAVAALERRADSLARAAGRPDSAVRAAAAERTGPNFTFRRRPPPVTGRRALGTVSVGDDTVNVGGDEIESDSTGATGGAMVPGLLAGERGWTRRDFYLRARVPFTEAVAGLYRNSRGNPFSLLPLAILAGLLLLTLPVTVFNFRLVGQLGRSFLQPVAALREGTRALGDARLDYRIDVRGDDELWEAARAFNRMSEGLERTRELEIARDRFEAELDLARRIQQRLLPAAPPEVAGLEIAGLSVPAREVGGDYFDHIPAGDGRVLLVVADVSGKGVPAALLMSAFRAALMSQDTATSAPDEVVSRLNAFLYRSVEPGRFVTAFVGVLDGANGHFVYANAGHNPPALLRADGSVEWLPAGGLILGILPETPFECGRTRLGPGDLLVLYTDGVTEGADATGRQYGEDRMLAIVRGRLGRTCRDIAEGLAEDVRAFEGDTGPADDVTVLVARVLPHETVGGD